MPLITTRTRARSSRNATENRLKFDQRLVLNQWMLGLFEVNSLNELAESLKDSTFEGFDEDNISRYYWRLNERLFERERLDKEQLLSYDQNIVRHWQRITDRRNSKGHTLYPKYFQYLGLLFTEIYLDRYFRDKDALLAELNTHVLAFNDNLFTPGADNIKPYEPEDLNKLAFWCATGSGKTLLMHVNILQYMHYLKTLGISRELNKIILLTPNEGLSLQHLDEFTKSGIEATLFSKETPDLFKARAVEIVDIHKLRDESGDKTVAVDSFEENNLVLVDEGHRGSSGEEWKAKRDQICERGFSFEYSATFGQAMKAANKPALTQEYAKCILFDYSYKFFYKDGYGKDYRIHNLDGEREADDEVRKKYLIACLLTFFQQVLLYKDKADQFRPYLIERPLWVFVGGKVTAVRTSGGKKVSDVTDVLLFLAEFVKDKHKTIKRIELILNGKAGLPDTKGHEIFLKSFLYLNSIGITPEACFDKIMKEIFNAPVEAALNVEHLKGSDGEIALRLGDNEPFGLINVGDSPALCTLCKEYPELVVTDRDFSSSLFHKLSDHDTTINLLIGAKKFTEGWNSWRVSTMGLMNIGKSEGSEIIQMFGRGVRLKGKNHCLKRSSYLMGSAAPNHITTLETLNIFGVRADYMLQFKEYLEEEGLPTNEDKVEFILPVVKNLGAVRLKVPDVQKGIDFKKTGPKPSLDLPPEKLTKYPLIVDWYPKIQFKASKGASLKDDTAIKASGILQEKHLAFIDYDALFFEMQEFKNERSWFNLNIFKENIKRILLNHDWYTLYIPKEELEFDSFGKVARWQELAGVLLKRYCDRYYKYEKEAYERPFMEYREINEDDPNFIEAYRFMVEQSREDIIKKLEEIKTLVENKEFKNIEFMKLESIMFGQHLYQPLIHLTKNDIIEVTPVPLNEGEKQFVLDLQKFHGKDKDFFSGRELYLLRNQSRGKGVGFFEAENFYPDFIVWQLVEGKQYVTFIDPKGIGRSRGLNDPKIRFHKTVKELESRLGDQNVVLNSFIISTTPYKEITWWEGGIDIETLERNHVLFQGNDDSRYIQKLLMPLKSSSFSLAGFAALVIPEKTITAAALAIVEQSGGVISSIGHLEALMLTINPQWCEKFLTPKDLRAFEKAKKIAPADLFKAQNFSWKKCRDYLERQQAISVNHFGQDQQIFVGEKHVALRNSLPQGVDEVVKYSLKALRQVIASKNTLFSLPQEQQDVMNKLKEEWLKTG